MWTAVVQARPCAARSSVLDSPVADLVEIDVERGLVELDDVDAGGLDRARLVVQDFGERPRELLAAPVMRVVQGVDHRHRAGQRELDLAVGRAAQEARGVHEHRLPARDRADDDGNVGIVAVADAHGLPVLEVHAVEALEKRRHEMPARLLAVGDDVDAGLLLVAEHQADRVLHPLGERVAFEPPGSPERFRLGEPRGLGQTAGDRRLQELGHRGIPGKDGQCLGAGRGL